MKRWAIPRRLVEHTLGAYVEYGDAVRAVEEVHQSYGGVRSELDDARKRIAELEAFVTKIVDMSANKYKTYTNREAGVIAVRNWDRYLDEDLAGEAKALHAERSA